MLQNLQFQSSSSLIISSDIILFCEFYFLKIHSYCTFIVVTYILRGNLCWHLCLHFTNELKHSSKTSVHYCTINSQLCKWKCVYIIQCLTYSFCTSCNYQYNINFSHLTLVRIIYVEEEIKQRQPLTLRKICYRKS